MAPRPVADEQNGGKGNQSHQGHQEALLDESRSTAPVEDGQDGLRESGLQRHGGIGPGDDDEIAA
jgi:hypothetical protein